MRHAAWLLCLLLWATPAGAGEVTLTYALAAGGFDVGTLRAEVTVGGGRYRVRSHLVAAGLIGYITGFESEADTEGALATAGTVAPLRHDARNLWFGKTRWVRMRYEGARPSVRLHPSAEEDDREPVPEGMQAHTLDPLSAAIAIAMNGGGTAPPGEMAVFDGRRRYGLTVTPGPLEAIRDAGYSGPARRLDVTMRRLAGHSRSPFFPRSQAPNKARLWVAAPGPHGLPIPVRVEADSPLGAFVAHLLPSAADD